MTSSVPAVQNPRRPRAPRLQAVLLDMDGTLVDTEGFWWDGGERRLRRVSATSSTRSTAQVVVGGPMTRSARPPDRGHRGRPRPRGADRADQRRASSSCIGRGVPLMPGAARLLAELAAHAGAHRPGVRLAPAHHRHGAAARSARSNFALSVAGDEVARTKPHPDPYLTAAARLGVDPARCVVVEDTPTGVASAEAAGCRVVAVPSLAPIAPAPGRTVVELPGRRRSDLSPIPHDGNALTVHRARGEFHGNSRLMADYFP